MTCRDCMWCDVCKSRVMQFGYDFDENKDVPNFGCGVVAGGFKNKADFVEVVRCKDCKYYRSYGRTSMLVNGKNIKAGWCQRRMRYDEEHRMLPDDFCSYGKRREE